MIKKLFSGFLLLWAFSLQAQNEFEKGYVITTSGTKMEVLIKNQDWVNAPIEVTYRTNSLGENQTFNASEIAEFKVQDGPLFKSVTADFPRTFQFITDKEVNPEPTFDSKTVFVERLLAGQASLYKYRGANDEIFLIETGTASPIPLVYKEYIRRTNDIYKNNRFRGQLLQYMNCDTQSNIQTVEYTEKSLVEFVSSYNRCADPNYQAKDFDNATNSGSLRFLIFAGIVHYNYSTRINAREVPFESKISPSIGLEMESILPFNNNKWSVFLSAQYASFNSVGTANLNGEQFAAATLELNQLLINLGGRHYMFLNQDSSIFLQGGANIDFNIKGNYEDQPGFQTILTDVRQLNMGGFFGLGYSYKQQLYLSGKYILGASLNKDVFDAGDLRRFAISIAYRL